MSSKNTKLIVAIAIVVAILMFFGIFGFGNYGMMRGFSTGFMLLSGGIIIVVLLIASLSVGIYWLIKDADHNVRRIK